MKKSLLSSCTILLLGVSPSLAGDLTSGDNYYYPTVGDINLSGTYTGGDVPDEFGLDLGGSIVLPFGNGWNAALDHDLGYNFEAGEWFFGGNGHVFYNNQAFAAGVFAHADTDDTYGGGAEAAVFVNNVDIVGKIGYFDSSPDYWSAEGSTNVYFDPNTVLSGRVGGAWGDAEGWEAGVGIEHRVNNSPLSGFAELGYSDTDTADAYHVGGGVRFVFGDSGSTLQDFNRRNPF